MMPGFTSARCRPVAATLLLAAAILAQGPAAKGEDTGAARAEDAILARKTLMNAVEEQSNCIGGMISERAVDITRSRACANAIYVLLKAFPHLFPPESNQWREGVDLDPATDTVAAPEVWTEFDNFYRLATSAADRADALRHAGTEEEVKALHRALGNVCDMCHALYYKE
jgi:cytochrome c556